MGRNSGGSLGQARAEQEQSKSRNWCGCGDKNMIGLRVKQVPAGSGDGAGRNTDQRQIRNRIRDQIRNGSVAAVPDREK